MVNSVSMTATQPVTARGASLSSSAPAVCTQSDASASKQAGRQAAACVGRWRMVLAPGAAMGDVTLAERGQLLQGAATSRRKGVKQPPTNTFEAQGTARVSMLSDRVVLAAGGCLSLPRRSTRRARHHGAHLCRTCAAQGFKRPATEAPGQPAAKALQADTPALSAPPSGAAPRDAVLSAATQTAVGLALGGLAARAALHAAHQAGVWPLADPTTVLPLLSLPWDQSRALGAGGAALAALGVTGLRAALLAVWPSFREATEAANAQVLPNLTPLDIAYVAAVSAVSEVCGRVGCLLRRAWCWR